ncbi:MAG: 4-hydroxy-tetrahydrodipicolinate synthase [Bacteriovoracales bacterium]|nr:4-hydroxy-tetrahydrodipicolinate synthase [Bacteriovoracales bacterium]
MSANDLNSTPLWTATVTPFYRDGRIDLNSLEGLLRRQEKARNGVVLLGSTGEALALDFEEQKSVVEKASSLNLSIPLLVGVPGFRLPAVLEWLDFCETQGVQGYLMPTPLYAKPGPVGQRQWFETLLGRVKKPCMLYNIPSRTGQELFIDALTPLKDHPNLWALKEASGSVDKCRLYHKALPKLALYSGDDSLTYDLVPAGCRGLVSVASNVWPSQMRAFVDRCLKQDMSEEERTPWHRACDVLFTVSNPIPTKALLHHKGPTETPVLRPPLSHEELPSLDGLLEADGFMSAKEV